ncbi:MAG: N-acetylglucosamine-6-phosphate deacetylase [Brevinema sp.]
MRLIITEDHVGDWVAYYVVKKILDFVPTEGKPFVLGIPGGGTVLPMYKRLVQFYQDGVLSFQNVVFFNTGEYLGIDPTNIYSFHSIINTHFFNFVDAQQKNIHLLDGLAENIKEEGRRYEELINSYGGVHLWVCGLGDDAHIAFNEPGSSLYSRTRDKELTFETRVANAKFFDGDINLVPMRALTIGIGTILDSKEVVVLAQGAYKSRALQLSLEEGINHLYPASALQLHRKVTFVADELAVADIRVRTYRYHKEVEAKSIHPKVLIKGLYKAYYALVNGRFFDGEKFLENVAVIIENDRIKSIETELSPDAVMTKIDLKGKIVIPGYIDLQVNGCGGADINHDISLDTLQMMYKTCLRHGTTTFAPTLITTSDERILQAIDLINHLQNPELLGIICWHFEGPYLSKIKKGIHEEKYIRKPSMEILDAMIGVKISRKIVTLAPEENEAEHIKYLTDAGIIVSIGHTNGTHAQIKEKIPHGLVMATHLYNAMRPFDSREPGAVGAVLDSKDIYAGIIVDGIHCNYASVDIACKTLGDHLFLVSDASAPAGTDIEEFEFGGRKIYHRDGKCVAADGTLAGVAVLLDTCVRNLVNHVKVPLEEAFRMASLYPARAIKKDDEYGYIKEGYRADLAILDDELFVQGVVTNGQYQSFEEVE